MYARHLGDVCRDDHAAIGLWLDPARTHAHGGSNHGQQRAHTKSKALQPGHGDRQTGASSQPRDPTVLPGWNFRGCVPVTVSGLIGGLRASRVGAGVERDRRRVQRWGSAWGGLGVGTQLARA